jgi:hypothetical protein
MAFSISTWNLPHITTYGYARKHWDNTDAFKNIVGKPLGRRADHSKRIEKKGDDYALYYHDTPLVTYHENGDMTIVVYPSQSSASFVNHFTCGVKQFSRNGTWFLAIKNTYYPAGAGTSKFRFDKDRNLISEKPKPAQEWLGDKPKMAQTRKLLKPFMTWATVSQKMGIKEANFGSTWWKTKPDDQLALVSALLNNPEDSSMYFDVCSVVRTPTHLRNLAYEVSGALYLSDVEFYRLPRRN